MSRNKLKEMLDLARELQASSIGLTIEEMMMRTERSRRTVERMMENMKDMGFEVERNYVDQDHHLTKRWKLSGSLPLPLLEINAVERSTLETLLETLPSSTERQALSKLLAAHRPAGTTIAIDQETLIERTAHLGRVGPRSAVNETLMYMLERAIQGFEELDIGYQSSGKKKATVRRVQPMGMLFGRFGYLVANTGDRGVLTYRMDLITHAKQTSIFFEYPKGFNLKKWASESFGIYHGDELLEVKLRFDASVADRAESVRFHGSQINKRLPDGSLQVILNCRGHQELFWELCHPDWAGRVRIEGSEMLLNNYSKYIDSIR